MTKKITCDLCKLENESTEYFKPLEVIKITEVLLKIPEDNQVYMTQHYDLNGGKGTSKEEKTEIHICNNCLIKLYQISTGEITEHPFKNGEEEIAQ